MRNNAGTNETVVRRERQNASRISESTETTRLLQGSPSFYYPNLQGETESLQKRMKDADSVLSEKMALTRQVIALQVAFIQRMCLW